MKRNTMAALFAPILMSFVAGCATTSAQMTSSPTSGSPPCTAGCAVTSGTASCNGGGEMCWVDNSVSGDANVGVFVVGDGCKELCAVAASCVGRVEVMVKHLPSTERVRDVSKDDVQAMCVPARP